MGLLRVHVLGFLPLSLFESLDPKGVLLGLRMGCHEFAGYPARGSSSSGDESGRPPLLAGDLFSGQGGGFEERGRLRIFSPSGTICVL